jgi:hypothetical protein
LLAVGPLVERKDGLLMALSPRRSLGRWLLFPVLLGSVALVGCGQSTGTIKGKVTLNGAAVKGGTVSFTGANKVARASEISEDGSYIIEKMPTGEVKITVETESLAQRMNAMTPRYSAPPEMKEYKTGPDPEDAKRRYVKIDPKYASAETSGLTYTVKSGSQTHDIEIK